MSIGHLLMRAEGTPLQVGDSIIGLETRSECNCLSDISLCVPKARPYKLAILCMDSINWRI